MNKKTNFIGIFIIAIAASFLIAMSSLGFIIKKVVNENIHRITATDAQLKSSRLNLLTANGSMSGLLIANEEKKGLDKSLAIKMDYAELTLDRPSLFKDVIYIMTLDTNSLEIHWHGKDGENLQEILNNITEFSNTQKALEQDLKNRGVYEKQKTLTIAKTTLSQTKVIVKIAGKEQTITIDKIEIGPLGSRENGMSLVDIMKEILKEIISSSSTCVRETLKSPEKNQQGTL